MGHESKPPRIGKSISALRRNRNITLEALATYSGVSKSMLFQIEQDKVNPSVATVWKVARGLSVSFLTILSGEDHEESPFEILRRNDSSVLTSEDGKCELRVASTVHFFDNIETYSLAIKPGGLLSSEGHFPGTDEVLAVQQGSVRVSSGENDIDLASNDSVRYRADIPHTIANTGKSKAKAFLVVYHRKALAERHHVGDRPDRVSVDDEPEGGR